MTQRAETALKPVEDRSRYLVRHVLDELYGANIQRANVSTDVASEKAYKHGSEAISRQIIWYSDDKQLPTVSTGVPVVKVIATSEQSPETASVFNLESIINEKISKGILNLLVLATEERFQDGMESNLSLGLTALITRYPEQAMTQLTAGLGSIRIASFVLAEILQLFGRIESAETKERRFGLLTSFLRHKSPLVRDAAATGLAYMNEKRAVSFLEEAISKEPVPSLREDLRAVVDQLKL
jgi:hypothetical protein